MSKGYCAEVKVGVFILKQYLTQMPLSASQWLFQMYWRGGRVFFKLS